MNVLKDLGEDRVFSYFEAISAIPRGSRNEKGISDYIAGFAEKKGLEYRKDEFFNVLVKKPGTKGYENSPTVILQGHIDMVCEKNAGVEHDFLKDPLDLYIDGDFIKARGTTLGGDNGVAVAYMLALLDDDTIEHPPIEALFTAEEELGMGGAKNFDPFDVKGRRFINMDTEEEGQLMVSCSGGRWVRVILPVERQVIAGDKKIYSVDIHGLKGGHSGADIHFQRASANCLMGRLLQELQDRTEYDLVVMNGGNMDNAICREAKAVIAVDEAKAEEMKAILSELEASFNEEYKSVEDGILITVEPSSEKPVEAFTEKTKKNLTALLLLLPYGVQTMSMEMKDLVESSSNIGIVKTDGNVITFDNAVRSSVESRKEYISQKIKAVAELCGAETEYVSDYPGWQFCPDSELLEIFKKTYTKVYGEEPLVVAIHAGLECGLFAKKIEGLDMISFGPNMFDVHTPDERLSISSTIRVWNFLKELLKALKN